MPENCRVGVVQMCSSTDPWENVFTVDAFVREAESKKVQAVFFPENVLFRGPTSRRGEAILGSPAARAVAETIGEMSASWSIDVYLGSVLEDSGGSERPYNSTLLLGQSRFDYCYRKIHLFDYNGEVETYRESDKVRSGSEVAVRTLGAGSLGLSICFDLRFPELYRKLVLSRGCEILAIPAAFTKETGVAHWHTLLRARAIENLSFVIAAAQWGWHLDSSGSSRCCYGHSIVYSPWGDVLVEAAESGDALLVCDLDLENQQKLRRKLPSLTLAKLT